MDGIGRSRGWDKEIQYSILPMEQLVLSDKRARINHYKDVFFKNYDMRSSDFKKPSILTSKFDILRFNGFHDVYVFLNDKMVQ